MIDGNEDTKGANHIDIRFGYRTCVSGDLALAVYLPDLYQKSQAHVQRWLAYRLENFQWTTEHDNRFEMWKARYLEGSWSIENGPRYHLENTVAIINALCIDTVGQALFKYASNPMLNFPAAQNTHAYQDAHRELYGYIIDGLDKETIKRIAAHQGLTLNVSSDKTLRALEKALPMLPPNSVFQLELGTVYDHQHSGF